MSADDLLKRTVIIRSKYCRMLGGGCCIIGRGKCRVGVGRGVIVDEVVVRTVVAVEVELIFIVILMVFFPLGVIVVLVVAVVIVKVVMVVHRGGGGRSSRWLGIMAAASGR